MSPVMRYTAIRHKDAIARKAARHYNIKTAAAFAAVLALAIGPLTPTVGHWFQRAIEHAESVNPFRAFLLTVVVLLARLATIVIATGLGAAVAIYTYGWFAKATGRWPYDVPPLGVETLRTRYGDEVPIEYDPQTGTTTAYQPNGEVLQRIQHDTDKQDPYSS
ncbi:hypothetical protein KZO37_21525 [Rhodococcus fascians]|uniref:hypothetical protein n=1 Tax=Rhodococcoides fascians TaxID=1828 RepID=UPI001C5E82E7|nr:hypothetical protein [Rhodococcus fascians]MBW4781946.1 hypothetical protein [Rhodococcus fascians]